MPTRISINGTVWSHDKQRAIQTALKHPKSSGLRDNQIGKHCGVAVSTIGRSRIKEPSLTKLAMPTREVTRNGTTYKQDVTNIGRKPVTE